MTTDKIFQRLGFAIAFMLFSVSSVFATSNSNNYLNLEGGFELIDGTDDLDDPYNNEQMKMNGIISLGFEHRFNRNWAAELFLTDSSSLFYDDGSDNIRTSEYGVNALYYFNTDENNSTQLYGILGFGVSDFDDGTDSTETENQGILGVGLRYLLNDHWSLRGSARAAFNEEDSVTNAFTVGVGYAFKPQQRKLVRFDETYYPPVEQEAVVEETVVSTNENVNNDENTILGDGDKVETVAINNDEVMSFNGGEQSVSSDVQFMEQLPTEEITLKINFPKNSLRAESNQENLGEIVRVAMLLKKHEGASVVLEGYTDDRGGRLYNQKLSELRAVSIGDILVEEFGIAADRIRTLGFGQAHPIVSNATEEGRSVNRRVVAVITYPTDE